MDWKSIWKFILKFDDFLKNLIFVATSTNKQYLNFNKI